MTSSVLALCLLIGAFVDGRPQVPQFAAFRPPLIPPGFDEHLPVESKQKLLELHFNKDLTFEQRRDGIEKVMDELPKSILEKLPLPPGLERLPEESKAKFKELHMNRDLDWKERHQLVQKAIKELPEHEQRLVEPPQGFQAGRFGPPPFGPMVPPSFGTVGFPPTPPPGFELVLAPTIYKQLLAVHTDPQLSIVEKKQQIDRIMSHVPQDQLDRLPLPPFFDRLSIENQMKVRQFMHNFKVDWDARHESVKEFINQLPREQRRLIRPPSPFDQLPEETQDQIDSLFLEEKLSPSERYAKVHEIIQKLPAEIRVKLPAPPPFMPPFMQPHKPQIGDQQQ